MTIRPELSRRPPPAWTPEIESEALAHAIEAHPHEAAGVIEGGRYVPLDNRSPTPGEDVRLGDEDLVRVGQADLFFHSHPDGIACPSTRDMLYQQQLGIPFVIATVPFVDVFCFGDQLARAPILGRGFRHGVHDCFALMRDWYAETRGIDIADQPRGWEWWKAGENLYLDFFERSGFQLIAPHEAHQVSDVLLFRFNAKVPMHGALVVDQDLLLHHAAGLKAVDPTRLSCTVPRGRYQHLASHALRWVGHAA